MDYCFKPFTVLKKLRSAVAFFFFNNLIEHNGTGMGTCAHQLHTNFGTSINLKNNERWIKI